MRTLLLLLLLLSSPALADPKADLRALIYAGDVEGVEAMMEGAHRASLVSQNYDLPRILNTAFSVTDPKMRDFIAAWRKAKPTSPHAMTAQAWMLRRAGLLARGQEQVRWTYPAAFDLQADLHEQARDLAWQAYQLAPDLVPASDAVLRLAQVTNGQGYVATVVADIMAVTPNRGSLLRGTDALAPNWGGSSGQIAALCGLHAAKVVEVPDYTVDTCLIDAIFSADIRGLPRSWAQIALDGNDNPILEDARITDALYWRRGTPAANDVLARYLARPDNLDWNAAGIHDLDYRVPNNLPPLAPEFFKRRLDHAVEEIVFDPYNFELLQIVFENVSYEGQPRKQVDESLQLEAKRRALTVAPYNAEAWFQYGSQATFVFKYKEDEADPFLINAIAYSNHRPFYLKNYGNLKLGKLLWLLYGDMSTSIQIRDLPESMEQTDALVCPLVRLTRVMGEVCATSGQGENQCMAGSWPVAQWDQIVAMAEVDHVCTAERTAPIAELMFQPHVIDWSAVPRTKIDP
jgi:hypothetical protein